MLKSKSALLVAISIFLAGCVSTLEPSRQENIDGLVLYGLVNTAPTKALTHSRIASHQAQDSCRRYLDAWCTDPSKYTFISLLLMNTYSGGLRSVGVFAPEIANVKLGDIVVFRARKFGTGEFIRVASNGETRECRWSGGGLTRALLAAGVICEEYDWRDYRRFFYD
jgi:hypothetical protein